MKSTKSSHPTSKLDKFLDRPHVVTAASALPNALSSQLRRSGASLTVQEKRLPSPEKPFLQPTHTIKTFDLDPRVATLPKANLLADIGDCNAFERSRTSQPVVFGDNPAQHLTAEELWKKRLLVDFGSEGAMERVMQKSDGSSRNNSLFLKKESTFRCSKVEANGLTEVQPDPKLLTQDRYLMTPAERRAQLQYEVEARKAQLAIRKAFGDKTRLERIIKLQYPHGVLGSEDAVPESAVYGKQAALELEQSSKQLSFAQMRRDRIAQQLGSNFNPLEYVEEPSSGSFTERPGRKHFANANPTRNVLTGSGDEKPISSLRRDRLAFEEHKGRRYDFLTGRDMSS
jgi:hypothetical protein